MVQRRCWLKPSSFSSSSSSSSSPSSSSSSSKSDGQCSSSFTKATGTAQSACGVTSDDNFDDDDDNEASSRHEKLKYYSDSRSNRFQYALEYLDQDVEEVHAKLRKDWFCMDLECSRCVYAGPKKLRRTDRQTDLPTKEYTLFFN